MVDDMQRLAVSIRLFCFLPVIQRHAAYTHLLYTSSCGTGLEESRQLVEGEREVAADWRRSGVGGDWG
jgi:hypothetical protein